MPKKLTAVQMDALIKMRAALDVFTRLEHFDGVEVEEFKEEYNEIWGAADKLDNALGDLEAGLEEADYDVSELEG